MSSRVQEMKKKHSDILSNPVNDNSISCDNKTDTLTIFLRCILFEQNPTVSLKY